jgi:hypothetical protein
VLRINSAKVFPDIEGLIKGHTNYRYFCTLWMWQGQRAGRGYFFRQTKGMNLFRLVVWRNMFALKLGKKLSG